MLVSGMISLNVFLKLKILDTNNTTKGHVMYSPETNMSPENQWLEDAFPIEMVPF